jgi:glutathione synthase/RimK-type ligase-like ATP-grasp enzyme
MKKIGVLFGVENSFPSALVEQINARNVEGIQAEFVLTGAISLDETRLDQAWHKQAQKYAVIVDRISHDVPFYRALLKHFALNGTIVINNPFWSSADDKFFNYSLAARLGVAVPRTVLLPHKEHPNQTSSQSMRNLEFPLDWESVFAAIGEHGYLKPVNGGGWRDVHEVRGREQFFKAYDQSRDLCMIYQKAIEYSEYFRCFVVGQKTVRIMYYDPRKPHAERYVNTPPRATTFHARKLFKLMQDDALKLCRALGYDLNSVEFAVENGVPYAIDFMNPVPDADVHSVGEENFEWIVQHMADLAIARAKAALRLPRLRWSALMGKAAATAPQRKPAKKKITRAAS